MTTNSKTTATCRVLVGEWTRVRCGRPAKGILESGLHKGESACGIHLAAERRIRENDRKSRERLDAQAVAAARSRAQAERLSNRLGVAVIAQGSDGLISYADLEALADRLDLAARGA